jgi:hypothetical protein
MSELMFAAILFLVWSHGFVSGYFAGGSKS